MKRLGLCGTAKILAALAATPMTTRDACAKFDVGRNYGSVIFRTLHQLKVIRAVAWVRTAPADGGYRRAIDVALWSFSKGDDAPRPLSRTTGQPSRHTAAICGPVKPSAQLIALATLLRALEHPTSTRDLHAETGLSYGAIGRVLRALRAGGAARVAEWERRLYVNGGPTPLYMLGAGRDAKRPPAMTTKEAYTKWNHIQSERRKQIRLQTALAVPNLRGRDAPGGMQFTGRPHPQRQAA